ncbi:SirQ [Aspergillus luchuensis]|uniref:SirQ n=1 Tax=Aspergillus kawachii TaxID=1069201 RepID=A0A146FLJ5_ASPKA|nr:SirQ [Aspergillus luchuensis]
MNVIEDKKYGVLMHFEEPQMTKITNQTPYNPLEPSREQLDNGLETGDTSNYPSENAIASKSNTDHWPLSVQLLLWSALSQYDPALIKIGGVGLGSADKMKRAKTTPTPPT